VTDAEPLSIEALKLRMERHYRLVVHHQQKGAEFEKRWRAAVYPVEEQEEVIEIDFAEYEQGAK